MEEDIIKEVILNVFKEFKQASVFNMTAETTITEESIDPSKILSLPFKPCNEVEFQRYGFIPLTVNIDEFDADNIESNDLFTVKTGAWNIFKVGLSEKKIPAKEVNKLVKVKIKEHKERYDKGYEEFPYPTKEQQETLKDNARLELAPKCFNDDSEHYFALNVQDKLLVSLSSKDDLILNLLDTYVLPKDKLENLVLSRVTFDALTFSSIAKGLHEGQTTATDYIELQDESGILVSKKENVESSSEVELALENNKDVIKIGVDYDGVFTARVSDKGLITNIKFDKTFTSEVSDSFNGSALLFLSEITKMVNELKEESEEV